MNKLLKYTQYLAWIFYNYSALEIFEAVYGKDTLPAYEAEKVQTIKTDKLEWFNGLDKDHKIKFIQYVLDCYDKSGEIEQD